ncbi:hypothetical protein HELRODRAFT_167077 [Helobdella robusta]|uniref:Uncharacterized protein n=1 Tax=Helobdella robusta TaxID=6412 RepID=T1EYZ6_HELRO|nr:hypothetical protein HELRODRAFT_167077 [Helobdella robusta]ESO10575.1 hypothetical protein HELRODRAFT_167077 [Helobdella robusta]
MASDEIKLKLVNYGKSTSIRGVPKCFNSDDRVLRGLWIGSVVICTLVLIGQLVVSIQKFYARPIMTQFGEMIGEKVVFPDITFCNIDPFATGHSKDLPIDQYFYFLKVNKNLFRNLSMNEFNLSENMEETIYNELFSVPNYIINLKKRGQIKSTDCPNFIVDSSIVSSNWFTTNLSCHENFTRIWNPNYYTCYTLRTSKINSEKNLTIRGLSFVLNVGPPNYFQLPFRSTIVGSQTRGVQVSVHSPGSSPDLKRGFSVAPGTETVVSIVQSKRTRQDKPYSAVGCTDENNMPTYPKEKYTQDLCIEFCKQKLIEESCGCMSHQFNVPLSVLDDINLCGNFSLSKNNFSKNDYNDSSFRDVIANYLCSLKYLDVESCDQSCLIRCAKNAYETFVLSSAWPKPAMQLNLFGGYIYNCTLTNKDVKNRYRSYLQYYDVGSDIQINLEHNFSTISKLNEIQDSLLSIKFIIKDAYPFYLADQPAYTWDSMFGVVGGTMSLWLGITISTGVELIELLYLVLKGALKNKTRIDSLKKGNKLNGRTVFVAVVGN